MEQMEDNGNKANKISFTNPAEEEGDHTLLQSSSVSLVLDEVIRKSPSSGSPRFNEEAYLLKVPHLLRQVNESAYEPQLISIGPYHHGKQHLIEMEVYKKRYLQRILERNREQNDHRYRDAIDFVRARKWYSPSLPNDIECKFQEIMIVDGCFIVELLRGNVLGDDPIFNVNWVRSALYHDFLLFENQLPFFVLVNLYGVITDPSNKDEFAGVALFVLSEFLPKPKKWNKNPPIIKDTANIKHLLSLLHDNCSPSSEGIRRHREYCRTKKEEAKAGEEAREEGGLEKWKFTLCALEKPKEKKCQGDEESGVTKGANHNSSKWKFICCAREKKIVRKRPVEWPSLRCATELEEAGIQFTNSTEDSNVTSLFDISFSHGTMKIPNFVVDDYTERLFRNLIAYEQYKVGSTYVTDFVTLMDYLINSAKDVQLLRLSGIIENMLGDDEAVAKMLNKLGDHVGLCSKTFYYWEIFDAVNKHCDRPWNTWKAKLRHDYFNSPWALVSFIAALVVILLTVGQFIIAVIPLVK